MEQKEQVTTDTRTESSSKIPQSGGDQDVSRNSIVLLQLNNQMDELGTLAECDSSEDLSLTNAQKPMDLLDIYTSMTDSVMPSDANTAVQFARNEEEDLYSSLDEINKRHLSISDSGSGLGGDFTLYHQDVTEMEIETAINLKNDNYHQLRTFVCQALIKGKHLPSWIMTEEASQIPKKISQEGYGWINQWSLKHKHCGNSIEQLEICLETLRKEWAFIRSMQSETERTNACRDLIEDQVTEQKIYEAVKFLMLYKAIHLHNAMENGRNVPEFCKHLFARSTSLYPYYLMINHLNLIGHSRDFEEIETELLKYTLEIEINI
ncbi:ubiquitin thioesterase otulin-like isoform X2 [Hypanus sabinus]|nr:ubiquitin thioesterase otulin-like isoform X2 [Hypanus sabinus]XP_059801147.1 ubiquitin thioesterase otulin-like isoform X2 [Hypanus sabinus]XP_059801148.1 ubiquitin thioesterase otulin-like isoform X2 [Hypanus sabinus]XP_059801149.1 ubiquitin thioesterase otulin-like isoform X2 [Hypanus sabinus]